jgi:hypothetical protein
VQVECNTRLESSRWGLQLCFRPHCNRRFVEEVMHPQSRGISGLWIPTWESRDKKPFGCGPHGELQSILYGGRWWLLPSLGRGESCESKVTCGSS